MNSTAVGALKLRLSGFRGVSPPVAIDAWLALVTFPLFRPQLAAPLASGPEVHLIGRLAPGCGGKDAAWLELPDESVNAAALGGH